MTIDWSRLGASQLPPGVVQNQHRLEFRGVRFTDAGRYLCTAVNAAGKTEGVAEVIVAESVSTPTAYDITSSSLPVMTSSPFETSSSSYIHQEERVQTALFGSNVKLRCSIPDNPTILWFKDGGSSLPSNAKQVSEELWMAQVNYDNTGRYGCSATLQNGQVLTDHVSLVVVTGVLHAFQSRIMFSFLICHFSQTHHHPSHPHHPCVTLMNFSAEMVVALISF